MEKWLDNLKLGYGGTKTEMERLLADAEALSGVHYDISNLGDVYEAIHVIQGDLGLTGIAAAEAASTITGSFGAMTASLKNVMGALTTGMDVTPFLQDLCTSAGNFLFNNLLPAIGNVLSAIPSVVSTLISTGIPQFLESGKSIITSLATGMTANLPTMITEGMTTLQSFALGIIQQLPEMATTVLEVITGICDNITLNLPTILEKGVEILTNIANGILQNMPQIITTIMQIMTTIGSTILQNLPTILSYGVKLVLSLVNGIIQNLPAIISAAAQGVAQFAAGIAQNLPQILQSGIQLLGQLGAGLIQAIPKLISNIPSIIMGIVNAFTSYNWLQIGIDIMAGIGNGIMNAVGNLVNSAIDACASVVSGIAGFFGIHSPSTLMRDKIGKFIPAGIAVGIQENLQPVKDAVDEMDKLVAVNAESKIATRTIDSGVNLADGVGQGVSTGTSFTQNVTINAPQELTPSEIARQTRNQSRQAILAMNGI